MSAQQFDNLLEGQELNRWIKPGGADVTGGWQFEDGGVLHLNGKGGNIITREQYGDFELWFEFRIAPKGNSGIKYRVTQYGKSWLGLEYQVLDDAAFPKLTREHLTASLYDLATPIPDVTRLNPDGGIQHWQNSRAESTSSALGQRPVDH